MLRWPEFEAAASELATLGRERFERFGFLFVGTVRKDGGPRVNPVEAYAVPIEDPGLWEAAADVIEAMIDWRPPKRSHFFTVAVDRAAFITYDPDGTQHVKRWRRDQPTVYERVAKG